MPTISLRFVGRFVFVESNATPGRLKVLVVDPGRVPEVGSGPHRLYATALRRHVATREDSVPSDFDAMIPLPEATADRIQQAVWDLSPYQRIAIQGDGYRWADDSSGSLLPDLAELSGRTTLDPSAPAVSGVLEIGAGVGSPIEFGKSVKIDYVPYSDADQGAPVIVDRALADMVEIQFQQSWLELELHAAGQKQRRISIQAVNPDDHAVVCLSNVCNQHDGSTRYDKEFAALYEVISGAQPVAGRLIPRHNSSFNESPCYFSAYLLS